MKTLQAPAKLDDFTTAYITAALWSETTDDDMPLDRKFNVNHIDSASMLKIQADCATFQAANYDAIRQCPSCDDEQSSLEQAGHDFWLTRNGHGAGFWDGDWGEYGDMLTAESKKWPECHIIVIRGKLHIQ